MAARLDRRDPKPGGLGDASGNKTGLAMAWLRPLEARLEEKALLAPRAHKGELGAEGGAAM